MADTLGSQCRNLTAAATARLNGSPDSAAEWLAISRQLRTASDKARKIYCLASRMENTDRDISLAVCDTQAAYDAFGNNDLT